VPAGEQITRPQRNGAKPPGGSSGGAASRRPGSRNGYLNSRARLLRGMIEVVHEHGYAGASATLVVARARASRKTFYDNFGSFDDAFHAAFDEAVEQVALIVTPAYERDGAWSERVRAALEALLGFLEADRALATLLVVEAPAAGAAVRESRTHALQALQAAIDAGRSEDTPHRTPPPFAAETVVAGVIAVIHARLTSATPVRLMTLANPLMGVIVDPYLGPAAAAREVAMPTPQAPKLPECIGDPSDQRDQLSGLHMRATYRTMRVLVAIGAHPGASNREVADAAGVADEGQISKLLARLESYELIRNSRHGLRWTPNEWHLTTRGEHVRREIHLDFER
jgi:AcrR family transcriptional regulator